VPGRLNPLLPAPGTRHVDWLHESLLLLKAAAEDNGVILAIENIPIGPLPRVEQVVEMVKRLDSPAVRICYDVANGHYIGEDPVAGLRAAAPWLDVVHLSDTTRKAWRHDAIGDGDVDFAAILRCIPAIAHAPKPLIELCVANPDAALKATLEALARLERR